VERFSGDVIHVRQYLKSELLGIAAVQNFLSILLHFRLRKILQLKNMHNQKPHSMERLILDIITTQCIITT